MSAPGITARRIVHQTRGHVHGPVTRLMLDASVSAGEMVIFDDSDAAVEIRSTGDADAKLVIGSAAPHPHPLHLGNYSVHTSADALKAGERHIKDLRKNLVERERQRPPSKSGPVPVLR